MAILLLLYGTSLGFPDLAISLGSTHLRLDDIVMSFISFCAIIELLFRPLCLTKSQLDFLKRIFLFAGFCIISLCITLIIGLPIQSNQSSPLLRMLGCIVILITLPLVLISSKRIVWLGWGLLSGGFILIAQILFVLHNILQVERFRYFFRLKNALSFETWNPNTPGTFALMFVVAMALIGSEMQGAKRKIFWMAVAFFSLVPFLIFFRGAIAAMVFAWFVFIVLARRNYRFKVFIVLLLVGMVVCQAVFQKDLLSSAISIDMKASETQSISEHYIMWRTALELAADSPLYGYGFGQEIRSFEAKIGRGMAHNAFLSVLVEGGLIGLFLFIWPLGYLARRFWAFAHGSLYDVRAVICLSFLLGAIILSLPQTELYWRKSQTLLLSMLLVYIGRIEQSLPSVIIAKKTDA